MSDDCTCLFGHEPGEICRGNSPIPEECSHWKGERIIPCIKCGIESTLGLCARFINEDEKYQPLSTHKIMQLKDSDEKEKQIDAYSQREAKKWLTKYVKDLN
ncbi:922_t:CDS:1 [Entrophospora sp. SA101]|nr:922_t:CDS:1 [Entrophospora sp. SA101]CAJ0869077.1 11569_t:CDS:1 [Entrophospora sp. SA101]